MGDDWLVIELETVSIPFGMGEAMATKILFSCQFSTAFGGVQHAMLDIVKYIDKTKYQPVVLSSPDGELPTIAAREGAEVQTAGVGKFWRYSLSYPLGTIRDLITVARKIIRLAREEDVKIVHTFDGMVFFAASLARLFVKGLKVIWLDSGFNLYPYHFQVVMRWCFKRAALVTTTTSIRQSQHFTEGLDPAKSAVTPLGTDFHLRRPRQYGPTAHPQRKATRIGIVGRIVPIKNFELFLRAARLVADKHPQTEFLIVGGKGLFGDELEYYNSILNLTKSLNLEDRVKFLDPVEDLSPLLATFDILVCSSHIETFGRTLVEAMALSIPVVATRVGGIPEVVADGETGFLVAANDAQAMAVRINQLIEDDQLRATTGQKGYERMLNRFDVRSVTKNWERIYERLLRDQPVA